MKEELRKVTIGTNNYTEVFATDYKTFNAYHCYEIRPIPPEGATISEEDIFAKIKFQKGPSSGPIHEPSFWRLYITISLQTSSVFSTWCFGLRKKM